MSKKVLFVTYSNGHDTMILPLIPLLQKAGIETVTLALTSASTVFAAEGLPYKAFSNYVTSADEPALKIGEELVKAMHSTQSGIKREESIAYLGLNYTDLIKQHGEAQAKTLFEAKGRHAFLPLYFMERVIREEKPDLVVTTNSPKSERAAVAVAKKLGIPTLSMVDLFGIHHFHPLEADYITIINEKVKENMIDEGVDPKGKTFWITGNPAFDTAFDYCNKNERKTLLPDISKDEKVVLWIDMPSYWNLKERKTHVRSNEEILCDLNDLTQATKKGGARLLVYPQPSQDHSIYEKWMKGAPSHVSFAAALPIYSLLSAVDVVATYTSIISIEALLMGKRLIQLKYQPGRSDMPLGEWGLAWQAETPQELETVMWNALNDNKAWLKMQDRIRQHLPQSKAAPKITQYIKELLGV